MELIGEYDEVEIPPVKPLVVRHRRFACRCARCGAGIKAPAPAVATTTPFGPRIHALAIYLKSFQALSYELHRRRDDRRIDQRSSLDDQPSRVELSIDLGQQLL